MQDYKEYLAVHVLNDGETVNYRMLSRALKIHSNRAKQCLFDFHSRQTKKKPNSVYATYLITGKRKSQTQSNGSYSQQYDDTPMPSSPPFPSSSAPEPTQDDALPTWTKVILLAKETDLESAKSSLDELTTIHIYSLSPNAPSDLQTLSDCTRHVRTTYMTEDPLEKWAQYGVIQNPNVWRRTRNGKPVAPPPAPAAEPIVAARKPAPTVAAAKPSPPSSAEAKPPAPKAEAPHKPAPSLKRDRSSIMSSFAKTPAPAPKKVAEKEEEGPALSDEDFDPDDVEDGMDLDDGGEAQEGKSKREREEELKAMMDLDDEEDKEMVDAETPVVEEKEEEPEAIDHPVAKVEEQEPDGMVQVENGRRRGRRRVMKKRTVKDEEGYLVTKEEAVWESFSEDEAPAPKKTRPETKTAPAATTTTTKKGAAKGQSGIMSFFAKR
ncbi:hypothetical protein K461DRAFT_294098 [Myriangium duriaei CBS 260.36]|uniref:DNA polymerase delta subunit 3 n=1 Tax=Myriangium duriaei CBS 260.36 TaxID=1168546 RepID=A0A9P4J4U0_9PEZI|nr:hypothetical protein K461DRAFT_294098 [Myriangium duriaei CBS 260.36]